MKGIAGLLLFCGCLLASFLPNEVCAIGSRQREGEGGTAAFPALAERLDKADPAAGEPTYLDLINLIIKDHGRYYEHEKTKRVLVTRSASASASSSEDSGDSGDGISDDGSSSSSSDSDEQGYAKAQYRGAAASPTHRQTSRKRRRRSAARQKPSVRRTSPPPTQRRRRRHRSGPTEKTPEPGKPRMDGIRTPPPTDAPAITTLGIETTSNQNAGTLISTANTQSPSTTIGEDSGLCGPGLVCIEKRLLTDVTEHRYSTLANIVGITAHMLTAIGLDRLNQQKSPQCFAAEITADKTILQLLFIEGAKATITVNSTRIPFSAVAIQYESQEFDGFGRLQLNVDPNDFRKYSLLAIQLEGSSTFIEYPPVEKICVTQTVCPPRSFNPEDNSLSNVPTSSTHVWPEPTVLQEQAAVERTVCHQSWCFGQTPTCP